MKNHALPIVKMENALHNFLTKRKYLNVVHCRIMTKYAFIYKLCLEILKFLRTFPFHFRNDSSIDFEVDNRDYTQELHDMQPLNTDDMCIDENVQHNSNFNTASGLWDFGGKSDHKPKEMNDLKLSRYCIFVNNNNYDL